ncbi:hypothetical protein PI124_g791 [Phytophthora idaei]|nr:hypothetical protein PI124_g791 [Phytophthora idaei]
MHKDPVAVSIQQEENNGWEELREKMSTNGPVTSVTDRAARDLESNADSDIDTLSNSAKREQEEKEHDEAQLSDYSGSANVFRYVTLRLVIMAILLSKCNNDVQPPDVALLLLSTRKFELHQRRDLPPQDQPLSNIRLNTKSPFPSSIASI